MQLSSGPKWRSGVQAGQGLPRPPVCGRNPVLAAQPLVGRVPALALTEPRRERGDPEREVRLGLL